MAEMSRHCSNGNEETVATSVSQRIGNLKQRGIEFEQRHFGSRHWEWKLRTPLDRIDFAHCELKEPADGWYPQGHCLPSSIATKAGSKDSKPLEPLVSSISLQRQDRNTTGGSKKIQMEIGI
jgi:hypothetical protein